MYNGQNDTQLEGEAPRRESLQQLHQRIAEFHYFLQARPETKIAVISHGLFLGYMWNRTWDNCEQFMKEY